MNDRIAHPPRSISGIFFDHGTILDVGTSFVKRFLKDRDRIYDNMYPNKSPHQMHPNRRAGEFDRWAAAIRTIN